MKVFLDDVRDPPDESWTLFRTPSKEFFDAAKKADIISLDHDLGDDYINGYQILKIFEEEVFTHGLWIRKMPTILIHSANPVGIQNMLYAIQSIERMLNMK